MSSGLSWAEGSVRIVMKDKSKATEMSFKGKAPLISLPLAQYRQTGRDVTGQLGTIIDK